MSGQKLLNTTLRINALFSLFAGIDLVVFDSTIVNVLTGDNLISILPTGVMLIAFSIFVFTVSILRRVNKYLVGSIIVMDAMWVVGSVALVFSGNEILTLAGQAAVISVALVIASFACFQAMGLRRHLQSA